MAAAWVPRHPGGQARGRAGHHLGRQRRQARPRWKLGADVAINYTNFTARVLEATDGRGVDVVWSTSAAASSSATWWRWPRAAASRRLGATRARWSIWISSSVQRGADRLCAGDGGRAAPRDRPRRPGRADAGGVGGAAAVRGGHGTPPDGGPRAVREGHPSPDRPSVGAVPTKGSMSNFYLISEPALRFGAVYDCIRGSSGRVPDHEEEEFEVHVEEFRRVRHPAQPLLAVPLRPAPLRQRQQFGRQRQHHHGRRQHDSGRCGAKATAQAVIDKGKQVPGVSGATPFDVTKSRARRFNIPVASSVACVAAVDEQTKKVAQARHQVGAVRERGQPDAVGGGHQPRRSTRRST